MLNFINIYIALFVIFWEHVRYICLVSTSGILFFYVGPFPAIV